MGLPVSVVVVAGIVMQHAEERALTTCRQTIPLWFHYVDDTSTTVHKDEIDAFRLHCVCLSHRECLIWVKLVKIRGQKFESQLTSSTRALCSDKALCFSQSERGLHGNLRRQRLRKFPWKALKDC